MDKMACSNGDARARSSLGSKYGGWLVGSRSSLPIEGQTAIEYNYRMSKIKDYAAIDPNLVWSQRVRSWLNTSFEVRMLDVTASTVYLIACASYIAENVYVYRNNTVRLSNSLYMFMVTNSCKFLYV